jgi:hypothetical protein
VVLIQNVVMIVVIIMVTNDCLCFVLGFRQLIVVLWVV